MEPVAVFLVLKLRRTPIIIMERPERKEPTIMGLRRPMRSRKNVGMSCVSRLAGMVHEFLGRESYVDGKTWI